ncbi:uncharacterized protein LOC106160833 [Lingula anatina]|uniref:Uncharacterized protein LOC106160833 n=1 Tax=Lingula anatina TaxID=7574 RepID=A0A1S3I5E2_LINAN|nr:uncharacterized protein LOC106160833 [Lingula anatina]XP_013393051.1 uncharacterized protein LOC106160833 [Lingula anatina]|eukprot:XP_013393050.1 uncharacterized protein LOC106160833 [Lingula anatina]
MTDSGHFKTLKDVLILLCKVLLKRLASKELYSGPYEMAEDKRDKLAFSKDDSLTLDHVLLKGPDSEPYAMTDSGHFKTLKDALILLGNVLLKRLPLKELYSGPYEMAEDERDKLALGKDDSLALDPVLLKGPDSEPYEMTEDERDKLALSKYDLNPLEDVLWKEPDSEPYEMLEDERDILALSKDDSTALGDILLKGLDSGINEMPEVQNSAPLEILEDATDRLALCSLDTPPLEIQDSRHFEIPSLQTVDNDNQDIYHTDHQAHQQDTQLHNEVPLEGLPYQEDVDVTLYHDLHPSDILFFSIQVVDDDDQDIPHPDNGAHEEGTQLHIEVPLEGLLNQWQLQGFDDNTSYQDLHPREMPHQQDMQLDLYQDLHPENTR